MQPLHNIRLKLAYDGSNYLGWQKTETGPSIEGALQEALESLLQEPIAIQAASRTDAGVHAQGQVVNFFTHSPFISLKNLNDLLPKDISVLTVEEAPNDFHPTLDCIGKEYRYHICNGPVVMPKERYTHWHVPQELDLEKMKIAASKLIGTHDFAAFCNSKKNEPYEHTIREITSIIIEKTEDNRITIKITGRSFLYKMVRNIVGTLIGVGTGKILVESLETILSKKDRTLAGVTAPAHGLTLFSVFYSTS